jgi:hypothetical protein
MGYYARAILVPVAGRGSGSRGGALSAALRDRETAQRGRGAGKYYLARLMATPSGIFKPCVIVLYGDPPEG